MVRGLEESHAWERPFASAIESSFHELPAESAVLHRGIHGDRSEPGDRGTLVHEVAADDLAIDLRDHAEESRMREQHFNQAGRNVRRGEVIGEVVFAGDGAEGLVADAPARDSIVRNPGAHVNALLDGLPLGHAHTLPALMRRIGRWIHPDAS